MAVSSGGRLSLGGLPSSAFASLFFRPKREGLKKERKKERKKEEDNDDHNEEEKEDEEEEEQKNKTTTTTTTKKKKKRKEHVFKKECEDNVHNPQLLKRKKSRRGIEPRSFCLPE